MDLLDYLPKILRRHKVIEFLCNFNLQKRYAKCKFNEFSTAYVDLLDPEPRNSYITGTFEPFFYKIALAFLPAKGTFFDLGANTGFCSFGLVEQRENAKYHLFEANIELVKLISKSALLPEHKNTVFYNNHCCLAKNSGFSYFNIQVDQSGQSHTSPDSRTGIKLKNLVLDDYCNEKKIASVDFAKIDIEGQEYPTILGWKNFLSQKKATALFMESLPRNANRYGIDIRDPLSFLENFGYQLYLCKKQDFANFAGHPELITFPCGKLKVAKFKAKNYPSDFSTEILAVAT
jgi:FkbM family methyltransferase